MAGGDQQELTLRIEDMAFGGKGIARHDGMVYFVAGGVVAGDTVKAIAGPAKKRYADAVATSIIDPSPFRVEAPCPVQAECGGCRFMVADYARQLEWKRSFVTSALTRIAKFGGLPEPEMHASPSQYGYRNRVFLRASFVGSNLALGYIGLDQSSIISLDSCAIAEEPVNRAIGTLTSASFAAGAVPGVFRMQIQSMEDPDSGSAAVAICIYPTGHARSEFTGFIDALRMILPEAWVGLAHDAADSPYFLYDAFDGLRFHTKPGVFQQVNRPANRLAVATVKSLTLAAGPESVLDLCCGSGNLSLPLAAAGLKVAGVESNPISIGIARHNVAVNGLAGAEFSSGDSSRYVRDALRRSSRFGFILLDPPREGLREAMADLPGLGARDILYLSCDPATLARDLSILAKAGGDYGISAIHCFDFFPHTWHVETLVHLRRQG